MKKAYRLIFYFKLILILLINNNLESMTYNLNIFKLGKEKQEEILDKQIKSLNLNKEESISSLKIAEEKVSFLKKEKEFLEKKNSLPEDKIKIIDKMSKKEIICFFENQLLYKKLLADDKRMLAEEGMLSQKKQLLQEEIIELNLSINNSMNFYQSKKEEKKEVKAILKEYPYADALYELLENKFFKLKPQYMTSLELLDELILKLYELYMFYCSECKYKKEEIFEKDIFEVFFMVFNFPVKEYSSLGEKDSVINPKILLFAANCFEAGVKKIAIKLIKSNYLKIKEKKPSFQEIESLEKLPLDELFESLNNELEGIYFNSKNDDDYDKKLFSIYLKKNIKKALLCSADLHGAPPNLFSTRPFGNSIILGDQNDRGIKKYYAIINEFFNLFLMPISLYDSAAIGNHESTLIIFSNNHQGLWNFLYNKSDSEPYKDIYKKINKTMDALEFFGPKAVITVNEKNKEVSIIDSTHAAGIGLASGNKIADFIESGNKNEVILLTFKELKEFKMRFTDVLWGDPSEEKIGDRGELYFKDSFDGNYYKKKIESLSSELEKRKFYLKTSLKVHGHCNGNCRYQESALEEGNSYSISPGEKEFSFNKGKIESNLRFIIPCACFNNYGSKKPIFLEELVSYQERFELEKKEKKTYLDYYPIAGIPFFLICFDGDGKPLQHGTFNFPISFDLEGFFKAQKDDPEKVIKKLTELFSTKKLKNDIIASNFIDDNLSLDSQINLNKIFPAGSFSNNKMFEEIHKKEKEIELLLQDLESLSLQESILFSQINKLSKSLISSKEFYLSDQISELKKIPDSDRFSLFIKTELYKKLDERRIENVKCVKEKERECELLEKERDNLLKIFNNNKVQKEISKKYDQVLEKVQENLKQPDEVLKEKYTNPYAKSASSLLYFYEQPYKKDEK